jgi:hypothetical protein
LAKPNDRYQPGQVFSHCCSRDSTQRVRVSQIMKPPRSLTAQALTDQWTPFWDPHNFRRAKRQMFGETKGSNQSCKRGEHCCHALAMSPWTLDSPTSSWQHMHTMPLLKTKPVEALTSNRAHMALKSPISPIVWSLIQGCMSQIQIRTILNPSTRRQSSTSFQCSALSSTSLASFPSNFQTSFTNCSSQSDLSGLPN